MKATFSLCCGILLMIQGLVAGAASGQSMERELRVRPGGSFAAGWTLEAATIYENFRSTVACVRIRNLSDHPAQGPRLYGEYFDQLGRLCFTAVFDALADSTEDSDVFAPSEVRKLYSSSGGLSPVTQPVEVRLTAFQPAAPLPTITERPVLAPITIRSGTPPGFDSLPVGLVPLDTKDPVVNLALAKLTTDAQGTVRSVTMLAAKSEVHSDWSRRFFSSISVIAQTRNQRKEAASTLVLLRFVRSNAPAPTPLARELDWVKSYVAGLSSGEDLPCVNELRIENEAMFGGHPTTPAGSPWIYFNIGTDWSNNVFRWVPDPDLGWTKRVWLTNEDRPILKPTQR